MTVTVRRLGQDDAKLFREIRLRALRTHPDAFGSGPEDWETRPLSEIERHLAAGNTFGLFDERVLAGIAALVAERGAHQRHLGLVCSVYLIDALRGSDAFDLLMGAVEAAAREAGLLQLVLHAGHHNLRAIGAYERAGYRITGTIPRALCVDGVFYDEAIMVKALDA